jgi:hypothetical protein
MMTKIPALVKPVAKNVGAGITDPFRKHYVCKTCKFSSNRHLLRGADGVVGVDDGDDVERKELVDGCEQLGPIFKIFLPIK